MRSLFEKREEEGQSQLESSKPKVLGWSAASEVEAELVIVVVHHNPGMGVGRGTFYRSG